MTDEEKQQMEYVDACKKLEAEEHEKILRECRERSEQLRREARKESQNDFLKMFEIP